MALINCPECGREISNLAASCPHCGNPMEAVKIERTGKQWKEEKLWASGLLILSLFFIFVSPAIAALLWIIGAVLMIHAYAGAWWHHG